MAMTFPARLTTQHTLKYTPVAQDMAGAARQHCLAKPCQTFVASVHALHPVLCSLFPELVSGDTGFLRLFIDLPRQFQAFYEVEPRALSQRRIAMKEAGSAEQFRLLQQEIVLAGEAVETLKRDQQLSGARSFLL